MEKVERVEGQELSQILHYLSGGKNLHQHMVVRSILQLQTLVFDYLSCWWKCFKGDSVLFVWSPHNVLLARNITSQKWTKILFFSSFFFFWLVDSVLVFCVFEWLFFVIVWNEWFAFLNPEQNPLSDCLLVSTFLSSIFFLYSEHWVGVDHLQLSQRLH